MHLDSIRMMEIDDATDKSDFQRAKDLCLEAVKRERQRPWMGNSWMMRLLKIAELEGDQSSQKLALTHLVLHSNQDVKENWSKLRPLLLNSEASQIIKTVTTPDANYVMNINSETAIVLLGSEGQIDQLLIFLKKINSPEALLTAERYLIDQKYELAELWKFAILSQLNIFYSSQTAWKFADFLKNIVRIIGSDGARAIKNEILAEHPLKSTLRSQLDLVV
jgi:hypothetical protein